MKPFGVILAGGRAQRMGGADKGLIAYHGRPLIEQIIETFKPQVSELLIIANRNTDDYLRYCPNVISDTERYRGPLFGILNAMHWFNNIQRTTHPKVESIMVVPCDTPHIPTDLVPRLQTSGIQNGSVSRAVYAHDGTQGQPLHVLLELNLYADLARYLSTENSAGVYRWLDTIAATTVDFSDCPSAFRNLNTVTDLYTSLAI